MFITGIPTIFSIINICALISIAGIYNFSIGDYTKAKKLSELYLALDTAKNVKGALIALGFACNNLGEYDKAIETYQRLLKAGENDYSEAETTKKKYEAKFWQGVVCTNIANCYINKGDAENGIKWYEEASGYHAYAALTLAQIYSYGWASQNSKAIKTLLSKLKIKKNEKLAKEWAAKACLLANNAIVLFGSDANLKPSLESTAQNICTFFQK